MPGTAYLFHPQTPCKISVSETFYLKPTQKPLRYLLRQNPLKSSIPPLFTSSKITTIPPKIPSNPYKIRFPSNSTENTIYNKEITLQNQLIYNSKITQTTSKINIFQPCQINKQHHSIEVIIFYNQTNIKNSYQLISHHTIIQLRLTPIISYYKSLD